MSQLQGKVAIITGGAGDIGRATGQLFAAEGGHVLLVGRTAETLEAAVAACTSSRVSYWVADVTRPEEVERYVQTAVDRYGGIDIFINNAGIEGDVAPIVDYDIETFDQVLAVNVRGVWLGLKYVIPEIEKRGGGSIVITSSTSGVGGWAGGSAYVASKHAEVGLMRTAAQECAPLNIRVNCVNPGIVASRMARSLAESSAPDDADALEADLAARIPLQRFATPEEVAQMMLFLASDASSYCTGSIFMVDGGAAKNR